MGGRIRVLTVLVLLTRYGRITIMGGLSIRWRIYVHEELGVGRGRVRA